MKFIGTVPGFAQRTYGVVYQTPYLPEMSTGMWRSPVTQPLIVADLKEFGNNTPEPDCPMLRAAVAKAAFEFQLASPVQMLHLNDVFTQDLDIWNKSPGLPWRNLGYKTKDDIRRDPEAINRVRKFWHLVKAGEDIHPPDSLAYVRSHVCKVGENKVRAVWGYPATMTFGEAVFALPLIRGYQNRDGPIAYGYETAIGGMRKLVRRFATRRQFAGLDFKKFDKTVPTWLIKKAFLILMQNIDFVNYADHGVADARRMIRMWEFIKDYFINTTIRTARGVRMRKNSGVASGSYFTQLIGSVCNYILCQWICLRTRGEYCDDILVLGDDSLFSTHQAISLPEAQRLMQEIGMELNMEKSQITTELQTMKFLGYRIGNGIPSKERAEWMTALLFPESPDLTFAHLQSRALGLYYANMCVDDQFAWLCKRLVQFRPFDLILGRDLERRLKYIGISLEVLKTQELPSELEFARLMI